MGKAKCFCRGEGGCSAPSITPGRALALMLMDGPAAWKERPEGREGAHVQQNGSSEHSFTTGAVKTSVRGSLKSKFATINSHAEPTR